MYLMGVACTIYQCYSSTPLGLSRLKDPAKTFVIDIRCESG